MTVLTPSTERRLAELEASDDPLTSGERTLLTRIRRFAGPDDQARIDAILSGQVGDEPEPKPEWGAGGLAMARRRGHITDDTKETER